MRKINWPSIVLIFLSAMLLVAIGVFVFLFVRHRQDLGRTMKQNEVWKIGYAMRQYESHHNAYPPRFAMANRNVQVFWPIFLEIETNDEFKSLYNARQPWDSTANLAAMNTALFNEPTEQVSHNSQNVPAASFVAVDDLATILSSDLAVTKAEVTDGIENTLLVAEVSKINSPWAQPRSLSFDGFIESCSRLRVATDGERLVGFEGQWLLFADSKVYFVVRRIPEPIFRAMWTRNGAEGVTREQLVREGYIEAYP